jgi:hypothetical protein
MCWPVGLKTRKGSWGDYFAKDGNAGANEYYSNFSNIGHNNAIDLIFLWIIPKSVPFSLSPKLFKAWAHRKCSILIQFFPLFSGAWLVGSSIMIWEFSGNILDGLEAASDRSKQE